MKSIGLDMQKNMRYDEGKRLLEKYLEETNRNVEWLQYMTEKYATSLCDTPEFVGFDYKKAQKYLRTWEIIQELPAEKKNMLLIYCACENDLTKTLEVYNGVGKGCKNVATLRVLISLVKKTIREKYKERYECDL